MKKIATSMFALCLLGGIAQAQIQVKNVSTAANITSGDGALLSEITVRGDAPRKLLFRGLGPSFSGFISDAIADPIITLSDSTGNMIFTNDNWKDTQQAEIQQTGLAPSNDRESAIVATLPAGSYTVAVRNKSDAAGTGFCEIYDVGSGSSTLPEAGARGQTGGFRGNTLVTAITMQGAGSQQVLVRGLGPSLAVTGALSDPFLTLNDANGTAIGSNDDWQQGSDAAAVQSSGLAPANPKEAALIATLSPGSYSAALRGTAGENGIGFVQFYTLPNGGQPSPTPSPTPNPSPTPTPTATPGQLLNIATRMGVQTDPNQLIGGFIITGTEPKTVVIRAIGPTLSAFFSGVLADPTLELFQGSTMLASNDNWKDTDQAAIEATGIAPKNDLESAIVKTLSPGAYTAIVRGKNNTSGIGLVEVYDLSKASNSTLANIATRGFVDTGDNVMIGGFIVGGADGAMTRLVVRAIGPSLKPYGIDNALIDPTLELRDGNGVLLKENDNWKESQQTEIEATQLAPKNDAESALVTSLPNGNYTAIVRGKNNTVGVALVEGYKVP